MRGSSVEIRLATVLTGLELLAWCQLVLVSHIRTDDDFRGDFGPQLELLLTRCGICLDVPKALPDLAHYAKTLKKGGVTGNGPRAIVEARNRVVHPPTHDRYVPEHSVREQAWLLALRYLELGILEGCGYDGDPLPPWANTSADAERVPWATPKQEPR